MSKIKSGLKKSTYRRPFENLKTAAGKRVRIAKDALLQLKLNNIL